MTTISLRSLEPRNDATPVKVVGLEEAAPTFEEAIVLESMDAEDIPDAVTAEEKAETEQRDDKAGEGYLVGGDGCWDEKLS